MSQKTNSNQASKMTTEDINPAKKTPLTAAERKRRSRAKKNKKTITIELTIEELATLTERFEENAYNVEKGDYYKNCILLGMKFQRNMGRPKGEKVKA